MEKPEYQNMKVWTPTLKTLRQIHAITGEQMVKIVDRLARQELERLNQEEAKQNESKPIVTRRRQRLDNEPSACVLEVA